MKILGIPMERITSYYMFLLQILSILIVESITQGVNPLRANPIKWPNTLKQFVGKLPTNCLSVFGHFVNLVPKGLKDM